MAQLQRQQSTLGQELLESEASLRYQGRYYLPYQPHASKAQFERAYPEASAFREVKRKADPTGKFSNELWAKYL